SLLFPRQVQSEFDVKNRQAYPWWARVLRRVVFGGNLEICDRYASEAECPNNRFGLVGLVIDDYNAATSQVVHLAPLNTRATTAPSYSLGRSKSPTSGKSSLPSF